MAGGLAWWGDVHGRGVCIGGHAWQRVHCGGHVWQGGMHGRGACMAEGGMCGRAHMGGGICGKGHAWQGACVVGGMHATHTLPTLRDTVGQCTGGTHPIGMHSCFNS